MIYSQDCNFFLKFLTEFYILLRMNKSFVDLKKEEINSLAVRRLHSKTSYPI